LRTCPPWNDGCIAGESEATVSESEKTLKTAKKGNGDFERQPPGPTKGNRSGRKEKRQKTLQGGGEWRLSAPGGH